MTLAQEHLPESTWLGYVSVPDVDAAAAAFKEKGGNVLKEPFDVASLARAAVVTDPQQALLGLIRIARGDPPDAPPAPGRVPLDRAHGQGRARPPWPSTATSSGTRPSRSTRASA